MAKLKVERLTDEEFDKVFCQYESTRIVLPGTKTLLKQILDSFSGKPIDFLSIGAGNGFFEKMIITEVGLSVNYFYGIEPDVIRAERLKATASELKLTNFTIDDRYFTKETDLKRKFNFILLWHTFYYIKNPEEAVLQAYAHLKPEGKMVIVSHGKGSAEICDCILDQVEFSMGRAVNFSLTVDDLSNMLSRKNIKYTVHQGPASLNDITDFIERVPTEDANHIVSFALFTRYEKLPTEIQEKVYNFIKEKCSLDETGKWLVPWEEWIVEITFENYDPLGEIHV